ncbi:MAG: hypothetical protein Q4B60_07055 [Erysipelotrichaceae bacterium]|nr:hypothetical protein [Erysipelotrichaceae bacterium]
MKNNLYLEIEEYKDKCLVGYWKMEKEDGITVRMYVDDNMQALIGVPDGYTPEECCQFFMHHIMPEDIPLIIEYEKEMMRGSAEVVYRYNHPEKGEMKVRCAGRRIRTEGNVDVMVGDHKELSGTVQIEDKNNESHFLQRSRDIQLKESKDYYWQLMDKASCGILVYRIKDHELLYMNGEALRIYGAKSRDEVAEKWKTGRLYEVDKATTERLIKLRTEDADVEFECIISGIDGKRRNALVHSEATVSLEGERCIYSTVLDISENRTLKNERAVLNTLSKDYTFINLCDLKEDSVIDLSFSEIDYSIGADKEKMLMHLSSDKPAYSEVIKVYFDLFVDKEKSPSFLNVLSVENLMKCLSEHNDQMTYRYHLKNHQDGVENIEISINRVSDDDFRVVMGFRIIDEVINDEKRQKKEVERRLDQIRGLASQFAILYFVNLDTLETENYYLDNEITPDKAKENDKDSENFFEAFKTSMVTFAHPDYQEELLKYDSPEYM